MSDQTSYEECNCDCHKSPHVHHVMACCYMCPICRRNIKPPYFDDHVERCKQEQEDLSKIIDEVVDTGC